MVLCGSWLINIVCVLIALVISILLFYKKKYSFWKNKGLEYPEPVLVLGNVKDNLNGKFSAGEWIGNIYLSMKAKGLIHAGVYSFHLPLYLPIDLELIKRIMQVDFSYFVDRGAYYNEKDDPLSAHLATLEGHRWKPLRTKLTSTFTSGKMKTMFPILVKVSEELVKMVERECCQNDQPIDAKDMSARFTTDVIGNCAFGIECNSLKEPNTEFRIQGKRLFKLTRMELVTTFTFFLFPNLARFLGIRVFPKVAADFFWNVIKDTTEYRMQNNIRRNDVLQLLLDMMNKEGKETDTTITFNELAPLAFNFFIGGFETSSTLMSFALLELGLNQEVQNKLRNEINTVLKRHGNELTYDSLAEMTYLEMVINETLRKYPPIPATVRASTKEYQVPNTDVILPKGLLVFISIRGIHYDPEHYPEPEKFDPTRFNEENKSRRHQFAFLPFGEGPRICLGIRFGLMEVKTGVATMVRNFRIKVNPRTEIPVKLDPTIFFTTPLNDLLIDLEKIT